MTTTIASAADLIGERLNLTLGTAPDPTTAEVGDYVRRSVLDLIGMLPLVQTTAVTLAGSGPQVSGSLTAQRVFYVQNGTTLLVPGEWGHVGSTLYVERAAGKASDPILAYHTLATTIVLAVDSGSPTLTIDTSCYFGQDWLEEGAIKLATLTVYRHLHRAGRSSGSGYNQDIALAKEEFEEWYKHRKKVWDDWKAEMDDRLRTRIALGDAPFLESPYAGFENASEIRPTYGRRSTLGRTFSP